jgi:hypothetical protein
MVGDEGPSEKPRVTSERKVQQQRGLGGFIAGKAARGARYLIKRDASRCGSDEMSLLYEYRCLNCGLISNAIAPNHWLNVDCEERCGRPQVGRAW